MIIFGVLFVDSFVGYRGKSLIWSWSGHFHTSAVKGNIQKLFGGLKCWTAMGILRGDH